MANDTATPESASEAAAAVRRRPLILAAVMMSTFMVGTSVSVVATAMPTIVADLGEFELFSWVFAVSMLAQAVTVPVYGKLADTFGRKPVYFFGIALFLAGSILCGLATDMSELIAFRALQGVGAGAVHPVSLVILGDIFTPVERARMQGYNSSMWGISSILGPAVGAFIVTHWSWSLVFWINLPFGLAVLAMLAAFHRETVPKRARRIDYLGSALLMTATASLMLVLIQGSRLPATQVILLVLGATLCGGLFVWQESRAAEPLMPLDLWRNKIITIGNLGALATGAFLMAVSTYLPVYIQGAMGLPPLVAGFVLAGMSVGWPLASTIGGRLMLRTTYRFTAQLGAICLVLGALALITLTPERGAAWATIGAFVAGFGMGFTTLTFIVSIQTSVPWERRGIATTSNSFMRTIGMGMGAAIGGAVVNFGVARGEPGATDLINRLMEPALRAQLAPAQLHHLTEVLANSLSIVYLLCGVLALGVMALVWRLPPGLKPRDDRRAG